MEAQKTIITERLDHLVAQRKLIAESLIPDLRNTVSYSHLDIVLIALIHQLAAWETQIVGKFNKAIEDISAELVKCGCSPDVLEEVLQT